MAKKIILLHVDDSNAVEIRPETAYDLILNGFKREPLLLSSLSLGEMKIPLDENEHDALIRAIDSRDFYEIKSIVSELKR